MPQFLSAPWWKQVQQAIEAAGELDVPDTINNILLNITVTTPDGSMIPMAMKNGIFVAQHQADATTHITLPISLARRIFIENDTMAGIQASLSGQLQVDGDISCLIALQDAQPTATQQRLQQVIVAFTD